MMLTIKTHTLTLNTRGCTDIIDITTEINRILQESNFEEGNVVVFVPGSTGALTTVEYESGLIEDLKSFFERIIPQAAPYAHNERWHDGNGYAHVRATLLKPDITIPFVNKRLCLGTWQQVIFIDFDNRARRRNLVVQLTGH